MRKRACRTIWTTSDRRILEEISGYQARRILEEISGYQALFKLLQIDLHQKGTLTFGRLWHMPKIENNELHSQSTCHASDF